MTMSKDDNNKRLEEIQARLNSSSAGPWTVHNDGYPDEPAETFHVVIENAHHPNPEIAGCDLVLADIFAMNAKADAEFIAAARTDIPWLIEKLARAYDILDDLEVYADGDSRELVKALRKGV